jgi:hypothetical protein
MGLTPATNKQIPDHAIVDYYNKQVYLGNQFSASAASLSPGSTNETPIFLLTNPSGNTTALFSFKRLFSCITASETAIFKTYLGPTIGANGTAISIQNMRPANANSSVMNIYKSPTISANGVLIESFAVNAFVTYETDLMFVLDAGQSAVITATAGSSGTNVNVSLIHYEL